MRVDAKSVIAGRPALEIRAFLKETDSDGWPVERLCRALKVSLSDGCLVLKELCRLGYVEPVSIKQNQQELWRRTLKGGAFGLATAAKPLLRATAERKVQELLHRVREVNRQKPFAYVVARLGIFGSFLSDVERINDIDVAFELRPMSSDHQAQHRLCQRRIDGAFKAGRRFRNFVDEMYWPEREAMLYLKSGARAFSFHTFRDAERAGATVKILYEEGESVSAAT